VIAGLLALALAWGVKTYDELNDAEREVRARWAQLEGSYRHRLELVPPLVELVQQVPALDVQPLAEARAELVAIEGSDLGRALDEPELFGRLNRTQEVLGDRVTDVLTSSREALQSPEYRVLRHQLETLESRIALERLRFNEAARDFNARRLHFPAMFIARGVGARFDEKPYVPAGA
jgi:LemA protein